MKALLKKFFPKPLIKLYHFLLAKLAAVIYGHPSRKMVVIGVTGTKGKSTVSFLTAKMLAGCGLKVGLSSTIMFKVGEREWLNDKKMTMVGRFQLQKLLSQMVKAGCQYAVVETSSEGITQYRHLGIDYGILIFTGLTPEHIEAHGSFENYKAVKLSLFKELAGREIKRLRDSEIRKVIIANAESEYAKDFLDFNVDEKITYQESGIRSQESSFDAVGIKTSEKGIYFEINQIPFNLKLLGKFNILNSLAVISVGLSQGLGLEKIKRVLESIKSVPGRMEVVYDKDFKVIVDYAHEPDSMERVYKEVSSWPHSRLITIFGGTGGGRDKAKRPKMGALAGKYADVIILTTDDPYDDNVNEISNDIEEGIKKYQISNIADIKYQIFKIIDRKEAIKKAINLAQEGDILLVLGKGCEQKMALAGEKYIDWDDRQVARDCLSARV